MNHVPEVDVHYIASVDAHASRGHEQSWASQLGVIVSADLLGTTLSLAVTCFSVNSITYGHMYAFPLIATNLTNSATPPAVQMVHQCLISMVSAIVVLVGTFFVDRRKLLSLGLATGVAGMSLFAWNGSNPHRSNMEEMIYSIVQHSPGF